MQVAYSFLERGRQYKSNQNFYRGQNYRSHYKLHESEVDMCIATAKCLGMIGGNSYVLSLWQKFDKGFSWSLHLAFDGKKV